MSPPHSLVAKPLKEITMGFNARDFFEMGNELGKGTKTATEYATESVADEFKQKKKSDYEIRKLKEVEKFKTNLISPKDQSIIDLNESKSGREDNLSIAERIAKNKRTEALFDQYEENKKNKSKILNVRTALNKVPTGLIGSIQTKFSKSFNENSPVMRDWQSIKSLLTDAQLQRVAKTKGAVSDREMDLFATAAANDDLMSISRMGYILDEMENAIESSQNAKINSYKTIYNEDPMEFLNPLQQGIQNTVQPGGNQLESERQFVRNKIAENPSKAKAYADRWEKNHPGEPL